MKGNVCKDATIEGLTTLLKLEREGNLALAKLAKREWVGFTHEELAWLNEALNLGGRFAVIEAIEAKLKEKNT
jgi:hypothetical protein